MQLKTSYSISQRDPRWANILLGLNTDTYTIGSDGCLLTSLAFYMLSYNFLTSPGTLNTYLIKNNGYVDGGYFTWIDLPADNPLAYISPRYDGVPTPPEFFVQMKEHLDQGYLLLTEIDFNPSSVGEQMHWVAVIGYEEDDFIAMDPWTGKFINLSTYGTLSKAVYSYRYYTKKLPLSGSEIDPCSNIKTERDTLAGLLR